MPTLLDDDDDDDEEEEERELCQVDEQPDTVNRNQTLESLLQALF